MATVVKLGGKGGPEKDKRPAARQPQGSQPEGLAGVQLTPAMIAGIVAVVLVLAAGLWFSFGRGSAAASTPMLDTSSETSTVPPEQRANGMDTTTGSGGPAGSSNGMDTGTGR